MKWCFFCLLHAIHFLDDESSAIGLTRIEKHKSEEEWKKATMKYTVQELVA